MKNQNFYFDIDYNTVDRAIWNVTRSYVLDCMNSLKNVFIPYCKTNKLIESTIDPKYGSKKSKETKNWRFYLYKQKYENMECFVHSNSTFTYLYILISHPKYDIEDMVDWDEKLIEKTKDLKSTFMICVSLYSEFSDDEYTNARKEAVDNILKHIDKCKKENYYSIMLWNSAAVKRDEDKVKISELINTRTNPGKLHDGWKNAIFEVHCDFHYLPNGKFTK